MYDDVVVLTLLHNNMYVYGCDKDVLSPQGTSIQMQLINKLHALHNL
jgi:hypothetical protein